MKKPGVLFFGIAVILLLLPILSLALWVVIFENSDSFQEAKTNFLVSFPQFLRGDNVLTLLNTLFSTVSILLFSMVVNQNRALKLFSIAFIVLAFMLLLWNLWTMM